MLEILSHLGGGLGRILLGLGVFTIVVFFHELGHFLVAVWNGVPVEVFSIGMGKPIWQKKVGPTTYMLAMIPIGGYVQFSGDDGVSTSQGLNSFHPFRRILVAFAGPLANLITGFLALVILFGVYGRTYIQPIIGGVLPDSPAFKVGLKEGDRILEVEGVVIKHFQQMVDIVKTKAGIAIKVKLQRDQNTQEFIITPEATEQLNQSDLSKKELVGKIGIAPASDLFFEPLALAEVLGEAWTESKAFCVTTYSTFVGLFVGTVKLNQLAGPIGIIKVSGSAAAAGFLSFLRFVAFLSFNLAVVNLIPIPALDGGQILFAGLEWLIRKPLPPKAIEWIQKGSFLFLLGMMLFASFNDIINMVRTKI